MQTRLTYIHHNCFVMRVAGLTFLFDYPACDHLTPDKARLVPPLVRDSDLVVAVSHSHSDHFSLDVLNVARKAASSRFVLSYDILEMYELFEARTDIAVVEPADAGDAPMDLGRTPDGQPLSVLGLESTDLGVGFLFDLGGKTIFYGGDMACWCWENADCASRAFSQDHYDSQLTLLRDFLGDRPLDLAFHNADPRLANWTGAAQFLETIRPRHFVPMHFFGETGELTRFLESAGETEAEVFRYAKPGDSWDFEL